MTRPIRIDALQYCAWSEEIFDQMRAGGLDAAHVTIAYHEDFAETVREIIAWNERFLAHEGRIAPARSAADIRAAREAGRTAILFGLQNPAPIGAEIGMLRILWDLGVRFMQLTYNNQSLLGAGCAEAEDAGLTRMGGEVIDEMNRLGMVIDLSHGGVRTTREAIDRSARPIAITHANPAWWREAPRNIPDETLRALTARGGVLGFSLYPHHLKDGSDCRLEDFCAMAAEAASRYGAERLGIGSDLCQAQPDAVVTWMRNGRWTRGGPEATFPAQPSWFRSNVDWDGIAEGLAAAGFSNDEIGGIMGENWLRFLETALEPAP